MHEERRNRHPPAPNGKADACKPENTGDTRRKQRQLHKPAATNTHPTPPSTHTASPKAKAGARADRVDAKKGAGGSLDLLFCGGVDGTRTRDPRRDRPVF